MLMLKKKSVRWRKTNLTVAIYLHIGGIDTFHGKKKKKYLFGTLQISKISEVRGWSLFLQLCLVQFSTHLLNTHSAGDPKWLTKMSCLLSESLQCNGAAPYSLPGMLSLTFLFKNLLYFCLKCPHVFTYLFIICLPPAVYKLYKIGTFVCCVVCWCIQRTA